MRALALPAPRISVVPEAIEPLGVYPRVPCGVGQVSVAEIGCQGSGIDALIDQLEPRPVPQQMRMHIGHADTGRSPAERLEEAVGGERCPRSLTNTWRTPVG